MSYKWYGHYENGAEFVIDTPKTPRHWYNYFFNDDYVTFTSQVGLGEGFAQDSLGRRIPVLSNRGAWMLDKKAKKAHSLFALPISDETREDSQIYLDLDYQLPPTIDEPKAREAWQTWLRYRRDMGGCRRISMKALHAIFDMLEFYHKTGGERAVVQILEYSVERERLNQLVAPRDVYRTPPPEPEPKPDEPEISQEESEEVSRSMREFLENLRRHRIPQEVTA